MRSPHCVRKKLRGDRIIDALFLGIIMILFNLIIKILFLAIKTLYLMASKALNFGKMNDSPSLS